MTEHWHHHGAQCLNRAAGWVLVEAIMAGKARGSLKASDPLIEKGMAAVKKLAAARGVPEDQIGATNEDLLLTVQAIAEDEPEEPEKGKQGADSHTAPESRRHADKRT